MSHKHHGGPAPVPPGNRSQAGPAHADADENTSDNSGTADRGAGFQNQDPKRRLGDYGTEGEHPRQQPTPLNDGTTHSQ